MSALSSECVSAPLSGHAGTHGVLVGTSDERAGIEVLGAMNLRRSGGFRRGTKIARQTLIWLTIFVIRRRRFDFIGDISTP